MQDAAVELFLEKGFDATTAAEIAARAGVTERTFFRHFPDKRDVLFDEDELHAKLTAAITAAPARLGPLETVSWAFKSLAPMFEEKRPLTGPSQAVIAQTPALQERQLTKAASVTGTLAEALVGRGIDPGLANLTAATGMAVAGHALHAWFQDIGTPLADLFEDAFRTLERLSGAPSR